MTVKIDGTNTEANPAFTGADTDTGLQCGTDELKLVTGGNARATVDSSGRVGIGTTSPNAKLEIGGIPTSGQTEAFTIDRADGTQLFSIDYNVTGQEVSFSGNNKKFVVKNKASSTESLRIDESGNVGIGTTSIPSGGSNTTNLNVHTPSSNSVYLKLSNSGTGNTASDGFDLSADSSGNAYLVNRENATMRFYTNNTQWFEIDTVGRLISPATYNATSGSSGNVGISSSGKFYRSTSSGKYKTNVETIQDSYADALLECRPVWYRSLCADDNPEHGYWGFIAEEVAEIDPRLVFWKTVEITQDENGSNVETVCDPEPEGVAYDRFVPHLLNLIKRQKQAIETLETQNTTQQAQIDDLLARVTALEAAE